MRRRSLGARAGCWRRKVFLTAWKELRQLREPEKLRPWLCGIARRLTANTRRREGREPVCAAEELEDDHHAAGPSPAEQTISREEEAILWRSLEQIPETYREPLILFYRESQSVEQVAAALELTEDAARQRLSRGRKLLQEQVALFVEGALRQSTPGRAFTLGVIAALPLMTASATAATIGTAAAKSGAAAAGMAPLGMLCVCPRSDRRLSWGVDRSEGGPGQRGIQTGAGPDSAADAVDDGAGAGVPRADGCGDALRSADLAGPHGDGHRPGRGVADPLRGGAGHDRSPLQARPGSSACGRSTAAHCRSRRAARGGVGDLRLQEPVDAARLAARPCPHRTSVRREAAPRRGLIAIGDWRSVCSYPLAASRWGGHQHRGLSLGLVALGGLSLGGLSFGGVAIGLWAATGGLAIGYLAQGGCALAWHAAQGGHGRRTTLPSAARPSPHMPMTRSPGKRSGLSGFFRGADAFIRQPLLINLVWLPLLLVLVVWQAKRARTRGGGKGPSPLPPPPGRTRRWESCSADGRRDGP